MLDVVFVLGLAINGVALPSDAVSGSSRVKLEQDKDTGRNQFQESQLTDAKLKADEGSRSKYSLKVSVSYSGPPVGDITNEKQPNPDGSIGVNDTTMGGSLGFRYRRNPSSAISFGSGFKVLTPFHRVERVDMNDPYLSVDQSVRFGDWQNRFSTGVALTTVPNYRDVGQVGALKFDHSVVRAIGSSRFSFGLDSSLDYFVYNRGYRPSDRSASRYFLGFYPNMRVSFSDQLSLTTSTSFAFWNQRREDDQSILPRRTVTQRVGLGWAPAKTVFINPFLNFYPENFSWDSTTISVSTVFSVF